MLKPRLSLILDLRGSDQRNSFPPTAEMKNWGGFPLDRGWFGSHYSSTSAPLLLGAHLSCPKTAASGWAATRVRKHNCLPTVKLTLVVQRL